MVKVCFVEIIVVDVRNFVVWFELSVVGSFVEEFCFVWFDFGGWFYFCDFYGFFFFEIFFGDGGGGKFCFWRYIFVVIWF